jgi:hypothetical protein
MEELAFKYFWIGTVKKDGNEKISFRLEQIFYLIGGQSIKTEPIVTIEKNSSQIQSGTILLKKLQPNRQYLFYAGKISNHI